MRQLKWLAIAALGMVVVAGCGGSGSAATQGPGAGQTQSTGGSATDAPEATVAGGPGGATSGPGGGGGAKPAGWDQYGKVHIELSGPVSKVADYGFIPAGSIFGGSRGSSLSFAIEGLNEIVSILISEQGKVVVSFGTEAFSAPAAECTTSNWDIGSTSGSGSFDCQAALVILASGATTTGGTLKGNFEAHT